MAVLYRLAYAEKALAFLESLQIKYRKQIIGKIQALAKAPFPPGHRLIRGGSAGAERVYRIRSGHYRVLYVVRTDIPQVVVLDIDHRKDVYR